jgi:hypothetical protein
MNSIAKTVLSSLCLALLLSFGAGCSKKVSIDTSKLDYSFQTAEPAAQTTANEAIEAVEKADYTTAAAKLKSLSANPKLTADQKSAITNVLAQLENH